MSFTDLPAQPPINPRADVYTAKALELSRATAAESNVVMDVPYGPDYWQKIDIYLPLTEPPGGHRNLPVYLSLHGGGWTHGYKEWLGFQAPPIVSLPAIYVSVSYRLAPAVKHPAALEDTLTAVRWVYDNIHEYGGSRDRIFIGGHSAGGHLSALATLRRDRIKAHGLPEDVIKGCFPVSGAFIVDPDHPEFGEPTRKTVAVMLPDLEAAPDASPINFVAGNQTPFFVVWAENDNPFCKATSPLLVEALKPQPGRVESHEFPGKDHFSINLDQQYESNLWVQTLRSWMSAS